MGHAIKASDPQLAQIDVSVLRFLDQEDIVLVELPSCHSPCKAAVPTEEKISSQVSLETKINQFHLKEERKKQKEPIIQVLDLEDELDRSSNIYTPRFIVAQVDNNSKEEEEEMALNKKKGLRELLEDRAKRSVPKDASGSQPHLALPPPPPPTVHSFAITNLKKKRKEQELVKEGELVFQNPTWEP